MHITKEQLQDFTPKLLPIAIWPDPILNTAAVPVVEFNREELLQQIADMVHTMRASNGAGLAATQVFNNKRIIVLDINGTLFYYINPNIVPTDEKELTMLWNEGCLSVPGYFEQRKRASVISVSYQDVTGKPYHTLAYELHAFALQHEVDHLDGKTFVDDLSVLKKERVKSKIYITLRRKERQAKRR